MRKLSSARPCGRFNIPNSDEGLEHMNSFSLKILLKLLVSKKNKIF